PNECGQAFSFDVVHGEVRLALVLADFVNGHDIWMLQLSDGLGLGAKALHVRRAGHLPAENRFDRHDPVQPDLAGLVNDSHTAAGDFLQQFVISETADFPWQGWKRYDGRRV